MKYLKQIFILSAALFCTFSCSESSDMNDKTEAESQDSFKDISFRYNNSESRFPSSISNETYNFSELDSDCDVLESIGLDSFDSPTTFHHNYDDYFDNLGFSSNRYINTYGEFPSNDLAKSLTGILLNDNFLPYTYVSGQRSTADYYWSYYYFNDSAGNHPFTNGSVESSNLARDVIACKLLDLSNDVYTDSDNVFMYDIAVAGTGLLCGGCTQVIYVRIKWGGTIY